MEKLMYLIWSKENKPQNFQKEFTQSILSTMKQHSAKNIRLTLVDQDVAPAEKLFIRATQPGPDGVVSFWLESAILRTEIESALQSACEKLCGYVVTESEPLLNQSHTASPGERTFGMNQVVLLCKPKEMDYNKWIDIWHNSHTQIAIDTQSTFGYRQNVISRPLTDNTLAIDAIVEENFPPEAMNSPHAFYNTDGNDDLLGERQKIMFESVQRFIDLSRLDCLPMSEYNF